MLYRICKIFWNVFADNKVKAIDYIIEETWERERETLYWNSKKNHRPYRRRSMDILKVNFRLPICPPQFLEFNRWQWLYATLTEHFSASGFDPMNSPSTKRHSNAGLSPVCLTNWQIKRLKGSSIGKLLCHSRTFRRAELGYARKKNRQRGKFSLH